jgi:ABC-2 type transport system permease protein
MILILSLIAAFTSIAHQRHSDALRSRFQAEANAAFDRQPDRQPHRMVHFGQFAFRPLGPLAAFDPGVDPFTGNTIFLEGHRQNSANFGDVRQSSLLVRFGQLTPAFVLQALAPLVLIFIGFGVVAREREHGTLRQLLAHGATPSSLLRGKLLALLAVAGVLLAPALMGLAWLVLEKGGLVLPSLVLVASYAAYLAIWALLVVVVSALSGHARTSLILLVGLWAVAVILVPRVAPDIAGAARPLPTRLESDIAVARDYRAIGDSHDVDDPHFSAFRAGVLKRYGVSRIEDLPVNYAGLLQVEGERLSATLYDAHVRRGFAAERAQSGIMDGFGLLSPTVALRRASMAGAGTDLAGHRRFLDQAEAYRYMLVQRLNQLNATALSAANEAKADDPATEKYSRISASYWKALPKFRYASPAPDEPLAAAWPGLAMLLGWLAALGLALPFVARRLAEASR